MSKLQDTGVRKNFESGASREIVEGKGRCDLLPLDIVSRFIGSEDSATGDPVTSLIGSYVKTGDKYDLLSAVLFFCRMRNWDKYTAVLEVSKQYEDGARKYAERNWEKGLPLHCFIDSGVRHYIKWRRKDNDEPHDRAFIWNMLGALWTQEHHPELNDLPFKHIDEEEEN